MAGVLHGGTRTTPRVRAEFQASKEKTSVLAKRYGLSRTTVSKRRARIATAALASQSRPRASSPNFFYQSTNLATITSGLSAFLENVFAAIVPLRLSQ